MLQRYYICRMNFRINWDALGISASLACAIHCALLPLLFTSFPVLGYNIIDNEFFEYVMIILAAVIGTFALYHGWKRHHHHKLPLLLFYAGLLSLLGKQWWHHLQLWFLIPAVVLIVAAHFINYRMCRTANHCHTTDCNH